VINSHLLYQLSYSGKTPYTKRLQFRLGVHEGQAILHEYADCEVLQLVCE
jgi:hypothetical protein